MSRTLPVQRRAGLGHRTAIQYPILTRRSGSCPLGGAGRPTCWAGSQDAVGDRKPRHAAAREHGMRALRHFHASVPLDAGESIQAAGVVAGGGDSGTP